MEWSSTGLRVLRTIADTGSFTAAAGVLGYTQSAVSRQVAVLERTFGASLFERRAQGVRLTPAGATLLRHGSIALDEVDGAARVLQGADPVFDTVRLGVFPSLGAALIPATLAVARRLWPGLRVTSREGSTPALMRSLRAGTVDIAVISSKPPYPPPDAERPPLQLDTLLDGELLVAVPRSSDLGASGTVTIAQLQDATWIASPSSRSDPGMGVWPGLPQQPRVAHQARDWLAKLALVAAGLGVTTLPPYLVALVPDGVRLVRVADGSAVTARVLTAHRSGEPSAAVVALSQCLAQAAGHLPLA